MSEKHEFKVDTTITIGNILTVVGMLSAIVVFVISLNFTSMANGSNIKDLKQSMTTVQSTLSSMDQRLNGIESRLATLEERTKNMESGLGHLN
jgi:peptidoglycan hydrolase CwlO-like protein